jgi:hypothetical protein
MYGGFSVVFGGNFRRLQSNCDKKESLNSRDSQRMFETNLNGILILTNQHRFKNDRPYGDMLTSFWENDITKKDRDMIYSRKAEGNKAKIPDTIDPDADWSYTCPYNKERNTITSGIFQKHIENTHPRTDKDTLPPRHTIIIEGHFEHVLNT